MNDNDFYSLSELYGDINGDVIISKTELLNESSDSLLTEALIEKLGQELAIRLLRVTKAYEKGQTRGLEKIAKAVVDDIETQKQDDTMLTNTIHQHRGANPISVALIIKKILTEL